MDGATLGGVCGLLHRLFVAWDVDEFDVEDEVGVWLDAISRTACAVALHVRDYDGARVTNVHLADTDNPSVDGVVEFGAKDAVAWLCSQVG